MSVLIPVALIRCNRCGFAPKNTEKVELIGQRKRRTPEEIIWDRLEGSWKCPRCGRVND